MKKLSLFAIKFTILLSTSCSKDDPTPEIDQEEVNAAELVFTEVEREAHGDHYHYNEIENPDVEHVKFSKEGLPEVGTHLHLEVGKTYKLELIAKDFAGRETQQTFVQRADIHQAFILGAPEGTFEYAYGDRDADNNKIQVGVTGYLTVAKEADTFVFRYIMRHLNPGVKANITAADWNNKDFAKFTGANDIDLQVEVHVVSDHGHDH